MNSYVYFALQGTAENRLDPAEVTQTTGLRPSSTYRIGDGRKSGLPHRFDSWRIDSPGGEGRSLDEQSATLLDYLLGGGTALADASRCYSGRMMFVVETGIDPVAFSLDRPQIKTLVELGAAVKSDLYWTVAPSFADGKCLNCRIDVPTDLADIRPWIGGELSAAELQIQYAIFGVDKGFVRAALPLASDPNDARLARGLSVAYIPPIKCLQFSSDFVTDHSIVADFPRLLRPSVDAFLTAESDAEFLVRFVERGDYQGTFDLDFDFRYLSELVALRSALRVDLHYLPEPHFDASGTCRYCQTSALLRA